MMFSGLISLLATLINHKNNKTDMKSKKKFFVS